MANPVQNARLTALEDEISLKEDAIRAQALELESLRRELRVKEARCTDLESSQRIGQKELAKAQGMQHDLEELVSALRRDTTTHELQLQSEREQKANAAERAQANERLAALPEALRTLEARMRDTLLTPIEETLRTELAPPAVSAAAAEQSAEEGETRPY